MESRIRPLSISIRGIVRTIAEKFKCLGSNEKAEEKRVLPLFYIATYLQI